MPGQSKATSRHTRLRLPGRRGLSLWLLLAAGFYIAWLANSGTDTLTAALGRLGATGFLLLLACSLANYLLRFARWQFYLQHLGHAVPPARSLAYYIAGFALTTTPGKAGETVRSLYLYRHGVPISTSLSVFFTERFLDLVVMGLISLLALLMLPGYGFLLFVVGSFFLVILALMFSHPTLQRLAWLGDRFLPARLNRLFRHLLELLHDARRLFQPAPILRGMGLGLAAWLTQALAFHFLLLQLGFAIPLHTSLAIYAIGILGGALSMIPGGIGATETGMAVLLGSVGAPPAVALSAPLIIRMATLWFAVSLGFISSGLLALGRDTPAEAVLPVAQKEVDRRR